MRVILPMAIVLLYCSIVTAQAPEHVQHWQYGALLNSTAPHSSVWNSPDQHITEMGDDSLGKLYKDLGGKQDISQVSLVEVFNILGGEGWELVAVKNSDYYIFKRPAD